MTPSVFRVPRLDRLLPAEAPARALALSTLANTIGNGAFYTVSAIYFTRVIGLSPVQVGIGLTVAGTVGLLAGLPAGHAADVRGPREVLTALCLASGLATLGYLVASSFGAFIVAAVFVTALDRSANAVRNGLIASVGGPQARVALRAYLRAVTNVGISLGTLLAGLALAVDSRPGYAAVIVVDAVSFAVSGLLVLRVPHIAASPVVSGEPRMPVLRDRPFLSVTALNGLLAMHYALIEIAVPLWVVRETSAPRWLVAVLLLVNTVSVVLFQVRISRGVDDLSAGVRSVRWSGIVIAVACAVFASAAGAPTWLAVGLLVVGALVHVWGEMLQAAGSWAISFGLAPEGRQGQYQGLFSSGFAASSMVAPVVLTTLCIQWGRPGWLLLGIVFAGTGAAFAPVVRWAERTRSERTTAVASAG
jgi:MFS family permease